MLCSEQFMQRDNILILANKYLCHYITCIGIIDNFYIKKGICKAVLQFRGQRVTAKVDKQH